MSQHSQIQMFAIMQRKLAKFLPAFSFVLSKCLMSSSHIFNEQQNVFLASKKFKLLE